MRKIWTLYREVRTPTGHRVVDVLPPDREEGIEARGKSYRASKTLAERAAWSFMEEEKPGFSLATICPPYVFGPPIHAPESQAALKALNAYFAMLMHGGWKEKLPPTGTWLWVDVRDIALAHVRAMEVPEAAEKRFFITAGHFDMKEVAEIAKKRFPEYTDKLPSELTSDKPSPLYGFDKPLEGNSSGRISVTGEVRCGYDQVPAESSHLSTQVVN